MVLSIMMVLGSMSALAVDAENTTLKVTPVAGHKYTAYQLFTGALASDKKTLSDVKWGSNAKTSALTYYAKDSSGNYTVEKTVTPAVGTAVDPEVLDYLASLPTKTANTGDKTAVAQSTADIIANWIAGTGTEIDETNGIIVKTGYYVITDAYEDASAEQTTTLSTVICEVVGPTTITPKAGETTHKKEVLDVNDTTETALDLSNLKGVNEASWSKTADHDFGDHVPFKLTTKIGSDFAKYNKYYLKVTDTLDEGLKLDTNSIEVYVDGKEATATAKTGDEEGTDGGYKLTVTGTSSFTVEFKKLNANANAAAEKNVVIYYTAELDKTKAKIGNAGNLNESFATFSNNPNDDQQGTKDTPHSTAIVFTYKTDVDKVDPDGEALKGAGFTLYKKYKAAVTGKTNVAGTTPAGALSNTFPANEYWYAVETLTAGAATNFSFNGIDDGTYILVESTTPDGYNTMAPITIVVSATHSGNDKTTYKIDTLSTDNTNFKADPKGGEIKFTKKDKTEKTLESGEIYSEIVNEKGATLPSTGGIGTTLFYVAGSILVLAAAILLITKRRMGSND